MIDLDATIAEEDRPILEVKTPEWKCGHVFVRNLSALEMLDLEDGFESAQTKGDKLALQLKCYLCDENGERICSLEQARGLSRKSAEVVRRIIHVGSRLNGRDVDAQEAVKGKS